MSLILSLQTRAILMMFVLAAMAFMMFVHLPLASAITGTGTSEDIPTGANDPTLPPTPNMSNTTSEDIPTGANDPSILLPSS